MAASYDTTTGLRALLGSSLVQDIDAGFLALATDTAALLGRAAGAMQEGVYDSGSYEVTQASGGAGPTVDVASNVGAGAFVQNDSATGQLIRYVGPTASKTTKTITTGHATLPRVDRIVLENDGDVTVVAGTATSGATLDNLTGAAAVPSNALLLADVHVPALDTTIANSQIRDRRKWARGAYTRISVTGGDYTNSGPTHVELDTTNLKPRVECSGVPIRVTLRGTAGHSSASGTVHFQLFVDGARSETNGFQNMVAGTGGRAGGILAQWDFVPAAGSHLFSPAFSGGTATGTVYASDPALQFTVEEIVRQNSRNNANTSG